MIIKKYINRYIDRETLSQKKYSKRFAVKLNQTKLLKRELKNKLNDQKYNYSLW